MSEKSSKNDDYYPLRWKLADSVENIVILYRAQAAAAVATLGILIIIIGLFLVGWRPWGGTDSTDQIASDDTAVTEVEEQEEIPALDPDTVIRPIATEEQIANTTSGNVIELGVRTMRLVGGAPSDDVADSSFTTAITLFPSNEVLDNQILSEQFQESNEVVVRVIEPAFFLGETAELNPDLMSLIADVAAVIQNDGELTVLVVGHAANGPLSTERAESVANELVSQGLTPEQVSFTSVGSSEPIDGVSSRIEFILR